LSTFFYSPYLFEFCETSKPVPTLFGKSAPPSILLGIAYKLSTTDSHLNYTNYTIIVPQNDQAAHYINKFFYFNRLSAFIIPACKEFVAFQTLFSAGS